MVKRASAKPEERSIKDSLRTLADGPSLEQLNGGYVCPPNAGPAWRAAHRAGVDMGLLEDAMRMTPKERLREHQRSLELVLELTNAGRDHDSAS